ncbi:hypothetical protein ABEG17_01665 [Pedococcus sp. KACC 23699]|uniref:Uncharacterized protein n=1 Tax=Pedococcus sp. KACC 23699 TaxID=3149228 RepID=A0AAU7JV60_9MICO
MGGQDVESFRDAVDRLSGGRVRVEDSHDWYNGQLSAAADAIAAVRKGDATIGFVGARAFELAGDPDLRALHAPMAIDSVALESKVLISDEIVHPMLGSLDGLGLHGLGVLPGPIQRPMGLTHPLLAASDYRGARIASSPSRLGDESLKALGATVVDSGFNGQSMASYDGLVQHVPSIAGNVYDTVASSVTANVGLWARPIVVFANGKAYAALPRAVRELLGKAAAESIAPTAAMLDRQEKDALSALCARNRVTFVQATPAGVVSLKSALAPVYATLNKSPATAAALKAIDSERIRMPSSSGREVPSCPDPAAAAGAPGGPTAPLPQPLNATPGPATALDGAYTVTTTQSQMPGETSPENWGAWTYEFDRGRFAFSQDSGAACTWGYGRYRVIGRLMVWDFADGGGIAPTNAMNKPGEHFVFTWSLYGGMLAWGPSPSAADTSPRNFVISPWRRVSAHPSEASFARRCPPPTTAFGTGAPFDGIWRTTVTRAELDASRLLRSGQDVDQDWGSVTVSFARGHVEVNIANSAQQSRSFGSYGVTGDTITVYLTGTDPISLRWSIAADKLTLGRPRGDTTAPAALVVRQLSRVGSAP